MDIVRIGVIGLGNIGAQHIKYIENNLVKHCQLTAICSKQKSDLPYSHFSDYHTLIDADICDAVLIATPTYNHKEIGEYALDAGLHVLMEKPIGLSVLEGEEMIAKVKPGQKFAMMLNQRTYPVYVKVKEIVDSGQIGGIQRFQWTMTNWFRPEVYFSVSDWRATWRGEGGGLLVNQCIHKLDILQWICGMPAKVTGFCSFGKYHDIEVEDEATAYLNYENGTTGVFIASTGEAPGINHFDIVGDLGTLSVIDKKITLLQNKISTAEFSKQTSNMFGAPDVELIDLTPENTLNQHAEIISNFMAAIRNDDPLIASAQDGLASLSLANSILLSSWQRKPVNFPLESEEYQKVLDEKIAHSKFREKKDIDVIIDLESSYR